MTGSVTRYEVGLAVWRLELPRPLPLGDTAILETRIRLADLDEPRPGWLYHAVKRLSGPSMRVRFDPRCLPRGASMLVQHGHDEPVLSPVEVVGVNSVHFTLPGFGPGRAGFTFDWDGSS